MRAFSPKRLRCSLKQCWFVNDCRRVRTVASVGTMEGTRDRSDASSDPIHHGEPRHYGL